MKSISNLGAWATSQGWWFVPLIILGLVTLYSIDNKTATVSGKEFKCTATSSVGIVPRCDQFTRLRPDLPVNPLQ